MTFKKVLITGGGGFLASRIVHQLRGTCELTLLDKSPSPGHLGERYIQADLTDGEAVKEACLDQDAVIHAAALVRGREGLPASAFADAMVKGFWNVAEGCIAAGARRLINISSVAAPGWPVGPMIQPRPTDDLPHFGRGDLFYSLAKHLAEEIGNAYAQAHGLSVIHLRPGVIFGDGVNSPPVRPEDGTRYWFAHVDARDVAHGVECALHAPSEIGSAKTYHLVAGRADALFDWQSAEREIGYRPQWNWPEIPVAPLKL